MSDDNNPFRPALTKPADDSVLANDPAADNFLAGNDAMAVPTQPEATKPTMTIDDVMPGDDLSTNSSPAPTPRLDQMMGNDSTISPVESSPMTLSTPVTSTETNDFSQLVSRDNPAEQTVNPFAVTPAQPTSLATQEPAIDKKPKKSKRSLLPRRKKTAKAVDEQPTGSAVFGTLPTTSGLSTTSEAAPLTDVGVNQANNPVAALATAIEPTEPDQPANNNEEASSSFNLPGSGNSSPIGDSLAAAADVADNKTGDISISPINAKTTKKGQPKQLTISILTIIFCGLFVVATGIAIYFGIQNGKNSSQLSNTQAELQELKDKTNTSSTSTNKSSTQFDALQTKIADLTKQNEEKQKTIDQNKKSIDDLTKKNTDLTTQLTTAQNKLASDTKVSDNMKSLLTTMCLSDQFKDSAACVSNNQQSNSDSNPGSN